MMSMANKRMLLLMVMASVVIFAFVMYLNIDSYMKIKENNLKIQSLQAEYDAEVARTDEITELKKYMQTDKYKESVARDKLGLVSDGQIVFKEKPQDK